MVWNTHVNLPAEKIWENSKRQKMREIKKLNQIVSNVYVCMYVCMYACMHVFMCLSFLFVFMYVCMYVCMYACIYMCMFYVYFYVCMYVCMYVCIYVCIFKCNGMLLLSFACQCKANLLPFTNWTIGAMRFISFCRICQ